MISLRSCGHSLYGAIPNSQPLKRTNRSCCYRRVREAFQMPQAYRVETISSYGGSDAQLSARDAKYTVRNLQGWPGYQVELRKRSRDHTNHSRMNKGSCIYWHRSSLGFLGKWLYPFSMNVNARATYLRPTLDKHQAPTHVSRSMSFSDQARKVPFRS